MVLLAAIITTPFLLVPGLGGALRRYDQQRVALAWNLAPTLGQRLDELCSGGAIRIVQQ